MSKYIIEIEEKPLCVFDKDTQTYFPRLWRVKGFNSLVFDEDGLSRLEELNSDYINEHYGELQDTAYKKGLHDGESKCRYCNDYQRGLNDAWEAAQKVVCKTTAGGMSLDTLQEVFGVPSTAAIMQSNTAQQAIDKIKTYEDKRFDRIEVGDEVEWDNDFTGDRFIVTRIYQPYGKKEQCDGIDDDGDVYRAVLIESLVKTGKHYDIQSILEAMRK